jgi:hypothetical protein
MDLLGEQRAAGGGLRASAAITHKRHSYRSYTSAQVMRAGIGESRGDLLAQGGSGMCIAPPAACAMALSCSGDMLPSACAAISGEGMLPAPAAVLPAAVVPAAAAAAGMLPGPCICAAMAAMRFISSSSIVAICRQQCVSRAGGRS